MERPNLRPVPSRPPGQVDPSDAREHVAAELPALDERSVTALALVELVGRKPADAAADTDVPPAELAAALASARTALRRALHPLPGSGWCVRAERLLSARLDGGLDSHGDRLLDVHMDNCPRCVEHDRRLAQARDGLIRRFVDAHGMAAPAGEPVAPPALQVVEEAEVVAAPEALPAAELPAPAPPAARVSRPVMSSVAEAGGLAWISAAGFAVALTILSVLIVILGILGASISF